jgi:hypothetical protein
VSIFYPEHSTERTTAEGKTTEDCSEFQPLAFTAAEIQANLRARIDNQIQDKLHDQMDAQRVHGGQTLEQFLDGQ